MPRMVDGRDVPDATVACPDLTTFTGLDELGLVVPRFLDAIDQPPLAIETPCLHTAVAIGYESYVGAVVPFLRSAEAGSAVGSEG
jgi:hypothetical protein